MSAGDDLNQYLTTRRSGDTLDLELSGEWRVANGETGAA